MLYFIIISFIRSVFRHRARVRDSPPQISSRTPNSESRNPLHHIHKSIQIKEKMRQPLSGKRKGLISLVCCSLALGAPCAPSKRRGHCSPAAASPRQTSAVAPRRCHRNRQSRCGIGAERHADLGARPSQSTIHPIRAEASQRDAPAACRALSEQSTSLARFQWRGSGAPVGSSWGYPARRSLRGRRPIPTKSAARGRRRQGREFSSYS